LPWKNPFAHPGESPAAPGRSYFVELIELCTESDHHEPELFSLLRRAFAYLNANDPDLRAVLHFQTELAPHRRSSRHKNVEEQSGVALANLFGRLPSARAEFVEGGL